MTGYLIGFGFGGAAGFLTACILRTASRADLLGEIQRLQTAVHAHAGASDYHQARSKELARQLAVATGHPSVRPVWQSRVAGYDGAQSATELHIGERP